MKYLSKKRYAPAIGRMLLDLGTCCDERVQARPDRELHCHAGAYCNRWTIVVVDNIDPSNFNNVIWAMCTRCDPRDQVDIIHGGWSSALDPMCYDTDNDRRNSRVVIDTCIAFRRKKSFPKIARSSKTLDDRIRAKSAKDLPKRF